MCSIARVSVQLTLNPLHKFSPSSQTQSLASRCLEMKILICFGLEDHGVIIYYPFYPFSFVIRTLFFFPMVNGVFSVLCVLILA